MNLRTIQRLNAEQKRKYTDAMDVFRDAADAEIKSKSLELRKALLRKGFAILDGIVVGGLGNALEQALVGQDEKVYLNTLSPKMYGVVTVYKRACENYAKLMHQLKPTSIEPCELAWLRFVRNYSQLARFDYASYRWYQKDGVSEAVELFTLIVSHYEEKVRCENLKSKYTIEAAKMALQAANILASHYLELNDFKQERSWTEKAIEIEDFLQLPFRDRQATNNYYALRYGSSDDKSHYLFCSPPRVFSPSSIKEMKTEEKLQLLPNPEVSPAVAPSSVPPRLQLLAPPIVTVQLTSTAATPESNRPNI